ncbi:MAG: alpha-E domain-containing protein [Desertimonas sp.]
MLLSRVADRVYWAARYMERAEDTARIVRTHAELLADLPSTAQLRWEPLVLIMGSGTRYTQVQAQVAQQQSQAQDHRADEELGVVTFLVADQINPGSVASCVFAARENLRTTRETLPREAWATLNDLSLYVGSEAERSVDRRRRDRFLGRVTADSRRLDGVLATAMTHDEAYVMWRLGRAIERADMTTRVLGVRAAAVLELPGVPLAGDGVDDHDEVQWMGVLRSLSGLQMYQRAVHGPIEGPKVVEFLLQHGRFPRSVRGLLREIRLALAELPDPGTGLDAVDRIDAELYDAVRASHDGGALDEAMDSLQVAIAELDRRITDRYLRVGA